MFLSPGERRKAALLTVFVSNVRIFRLRKMLLTFGTSPMKYYEFLNSLQFTVLTLKHNAKAKHCTLTTSSCIPINLKYCAARTLDLTECVFSSQRNNEK